MPLLGRRRKEHRLQLIRVSPEDRLDPQLDVIFVHGLGGDAVGTWSPGQSDSAESFPERLSTDLDTAAVWSLGYPAAPSRWTTGGQGLDILERARSVLDYLISFGIGKRPLVFVCHSLGGLVVKQVLRTAAELGVPQFHPVWEQTRGVVFLATPHAGSSLASIAKALRLVRATKATLNLEAHDTALRELGDWYRQHATDHDLQTVAYAETRGIKSLGLVVNRTSADPTVRGTIVIDTDEDHFSISKPPSAESPVYAGTLRFLIDIMTASTAPQSERRRELERIGTADCPRIDEVDPGVLGVLPYGLADRVDEWSLPVYVRRSVDDTLDEALMEAAGGIGLVVVTGHSKAGKTRTLYEALKRLAPPRRVFAVAPPSKDDYRPLERLAELTDLLEDVHDLVVWIDDAHEHLERGLTRDVLDTLTARLPGGAIMAMTVHLDPLQQDKSRIGADIKERLLQVARHTTLERKLDDTELGVARTIHPDLADREDLAFLAAVLAAVPQLRNKLDTSDQPVGRAIVDAAIAWQRTGMVAAIPVEQLRNLTKLVLPTYTMQSLTDHAFSNGLRWASDPVTSAANAALLTLLDDDRWRPFDVFVAEAEPPADDLWNTVLGFAAPEDLDSIGFSAIIDNHPDRAQLAWSQAADHGDPGAMSNLGVLLDERGEVTEAEDWYRKAADLGHPAAMYNLGVHLEERGEETEAEDWYRKAADLRFPAAMTNLGVLLNNRGEETEAEDWYRKAADLGDPGAMYRLGVLLNERRELTEAEEWSRKAADLGDPAAMSNLGVLLSNRGEETEAEDWWRKAADLGDLGAMYNLGVLLEERAENEAEDWYRKAADLGYPDAMSNLGAILKERGEETEAEEWWRRAADLGYPDAMSNLGVILKERGEETEAEDWYRKAADLGHLTAMSNLGAILKERGEETDAEDWWRRAADLGHLTAMYNLGVHLNERGEETDAEDWWRKAADLGDPAAMYNLGVLLNNRGEETDAEDWWRKAADLGYPGAMSNLGVLLEERGEETDAEDWYRKAADLGHTDAMYNLGVRLSNRGEETDAEDWYRKAADLGDPGAMSSLGVLLEERGEETDAEDWYRKAADVGYPDAMSSLGVLLNNRGELTEAEDWYRKAADLGHPAAMSNLGVLLEERGELTEAEEWYARAADSEGTDNGVT